MTRLPNIPKELLLKIAGGDSQAFTQLFDACWLQVFAHVRRYLKNTAEAEDITQEIFFHLWINRLKLPEVQEFEPWLFVITRNRTISGLRKLLKETTGAMAGTIPEISDQPSSTPAGQLDYKQSCELLEKAIDQMPARRREVFRLSRQEGLTHAEIAEQLNISKATVNEHIREALAFLKMKFGESPGLLTALLLISACWLARK
ncbi:RNA polymerase sigma-70 factor [Paraflavitalea sp. CAU 1676]|uniref:RNA polymerase sigma-70 factor n=1 Tax=Paraflavitalea sp. CAU 1676 TaxID=3032598 RepID=UPI0023DB4709|nr:RNA polymerase sigma-70 factor [Paraflavitalea sp. CAU 1676]MDF2193348.1 RNA polymerase sigma-70 factor [Paraflavitalea sp. CAU 1676]